MDELPRSLAALVNEARSAHDPRPEDARRIGAALTAAIPGLLPPAHGGTMDASAASGAVTSGSTVVGLGGVAKFVGVMVALAAAGAAIALRSPSTERPMRTPSAVAARAASDRGTASTAITNSNKTDADTNVSATTTSTRKNASAPLAPTPALAPRLRSEPAVARTPSVAARRATTATNAQPVAVTPTSEELPLIRRAAEALRDHDPALARKFLEQHAAHFPQGALERERVAMTLVALCEEGKLGQARAMRDQFLAETPDSPLAARVRNACREPEP